jgi:hypothetical protein
MATRREVLILALVTPWLAACSGGDSGTQNPASRLLRSGSSTLPNHGTYGTRIASWSQLGKANGASLVTPTELPRFAENAIKVLRLRQDPGVSFGEQNPIDTGQAYLPRGVTPGFTLGLWARNPNRRTLNFELLVFNQSGDHIIRWNCAIEPTNSWTFLTLSPSQQISLGWRFGSDAIESVRITQQDHLAEGAWLPDEYLLFGNVYADVASRPLFLITFDDGFYSQRNRNPRPIVSRRAFVSRTDDDVLTTAANHVLVLGEPIAFTDVAPTGLVVGTTYWVSSLPSSSTFTLAPDEMLGSEVRTSGFVGTANYQYAGTALRSGQQIVESHGLKGSLFLVPSWLGSSGVYGYGGGTNKFMSADDARAMYSEGWSVGSHSNTHPSNQDSAGLRLLGPYGYFLSNPVDNLDPPYVALWGLGPEHRRRAIGAAAGTDLVTFENPHQFLVNMPIIFTDNAPSGLTTGTIYYCQAIPSATTATFATDQGSLRSRATVASDWVGVANYQFAGASNDDSAIYADIQAGVAGVAALGIPTGGKFFALPQGGADEYVRSACIRAGLTWVRGASWHAHTIPVGRPSGGGLSGIANPPGGWLAQPDCVQTDAARSPSIRDIESYVDDTILQGACGCSYHHHIGGGTIANLDNICGYLRRQVDANAIDVVTLDQMAAALKLFDQFPR